MIVFRCDKRRMPYIMDLEYDAFVREHVPKTQLIVISIISTRYVHHICITYPLTVMKVETNFMKNTCEL